MGSAFFDPQIESMPTDSLIIRPLGILRFYSGGTCSRAAQIDILRGYRPLRASAGFTAFLFDEGSLLCGILFRQYASFNGAAPWRRLIGYSPDQSLKSTIGS